MNELYKNVIFEYAYGWASDISAMVLDDEGLFDFYAHRSKDILSSVVKFNKTTVLHVYIEFVLREYYDFRLQEMLRDHEYEILEAEAIKLLDAYNIEYESVELEDLLSGEDYELHEPEASEYTTYLFSLIRVAIPRMIEDIFYVLYGDRVFLLNFNLKIGNLISKLEVVEHGGILKRDGVLKRCTYVPTWLRSALIHRDKGRCMGCGKDLTGVLIRGERIHYDHIVPLAQHGINDPTNLQLLCEDCNLDKSFTEIYTLGKYPSYW